MELKPRLLVLYATQTGNAQDIAERVGREAERLFFNTAVIGMDKFDPGKLPAEKLAVFIVSTTGQGDQPDMMKNFWKSLLKRSLSALWLEGLKYAVFGLGDSGYQQYNVVAKKLDRRLSDLGGTPITEKGLGDDQHPLGYEASLDSWLESFWMSMASMSGQALDLSVLRFNKLVLDKPKYKVVLCKTTSVVSPNKNRCLEEANRAVRMLDMVDSVNEFDEPDDFSEIGPRNPYLARMVCNKRLTKDTSERDVRHIEFGLGYSGLSYKPGDVLAVIPSQSDNTVEAFINRCSLDPDAQVLVQPARTSQKLWQRDFDTKKPITTRTLVQSVLDIASASPRRYFFEVMSHFATAEHEKERLTYFASPEGQGDLYKYNQRERRTVLEVLEDFPSVQLPLEWLLQLVPRLQPRFFSISSSMLMHPDQVHITVAVQKWKTPFKRTRFGLCSTWLSHLDPQKDDIYVPIWIKKGLEFPDALVPLILVGPGTGCAPFRALIEEYIAISASTSVAPIMFFFGCRQEQDDFLYNDFWLAQAEGSGILGEKRGGGFFVAFSRDQPKKIYVQHKINEHSEQVWAMLNSRKCAVYVAGSAVKMPEDVFAAFEKVVMKEGCQSEDAARKWLKQLERVGRYHVEAW